MEAKKAPLFVLAGAILVAGLIVAGSGRDDPALEARIAGLERQVATLEQQAATEMTRAEARRSTAQASAVFQERRRDLSERTRARSIGLAPAEVVPAPDVSAEFSEVLRVGGGDPDVRARLGRVIRDEMEVAQEERREERRERRAERRERRLDQLRADAGLTEEQTEFLSVLLTDESAAARALFRAAREEGTWGEAHDQVEDLRSETDELAADQFEGDQLEAYRAMREEEEARRYGRRR
jgi:hypothetical protein